MSCVVLLSALAFVFVCFIFVFLYYLFYVFFFFSSRRRHTRCLSDWSSDVCSSDLGLGLRRCPVVGRCRELGASDELCVGGRQVDQGEIAGRKRVATFLVTTDPPQIGRASCRERV